MYNIINVYIYKYIYIYIYIEGEREREREFQGPFQVSFLQKDIKHIILIKPF